MVLYGPGFTSELYQASAFDANGALSSAGMTSLISLQVEEKKEPLKVLVRDIQRDVLTDALLHVDLYRVSMTQEITTEIPIELIGESLIVTQGTAMVLHLMDRVEIECLPGDLVPSLELDISLLQNVDDALHVKDLSVPEGITVLTDGEGVIVRLAHAVRLPEEEEEEEELPVEVAADEVEVISRGKVEEEEAE
jgi:large subunit ribosomal protein L25